MTINRTDRTYRINVCPPIDDQFETDRWIQDIETGDFFLVVPVEQIRAVRQRVREREEDRHRRGIAIGQVVFWCLIGVFVWIAIIQLVRYIHG